MMMNKAELATVKGGAVSWGIIGAIVGGALTFIIGIIDGFMRPLSCN